MGEAGQLGGRSSDSAQASGSEVCGVALLPAFGKGARAYQEASLPGGAESADRKTTGNR